MRRGQRLLLGHYPLEAAFLDALALLAAEVDGLGEEVLDGGLGGCAHEDLVGEETAAEVDEKAVDPEEDVADAAAADGLGVGGGDAAHLEDLITGLLE